MTIRRVVDINAVLIPAPSFVFNYQGVTVASIIKFFNVAMVG